RLPLLDRLRRARSRTARLPRPRLRARGGRGHPAGTHREHLAPRAPAGLGKQVGSLAMDDEIEVRRSKRRRRTVSAYRDGEKIIVMIPTAMSAREEADWVVQMVERLERAERRRKPSDDDLMKRATSLNDLYFGGIAVPDSVRWVDNQQARWG